MYPSLDHSPVMPFYMCVEKRTQASSNNWRVALLIIVKSMNSSLWPFLPSVLVNILCWTSNNVIVSFWFKSLTVLILTKNSNCSGIGGLDPGVVASAILKGVKAATSTTPLYSLTKIRLVLIKIKVFLAFKEEATQTFSTAVINRGDGNSYLFLWLLESEFSHFIGNVPLIFNF